MRGIRLAATCILILLVAGSTGAVAQDEDDMEVRERREEFLFLLDHGESARLEIEMEEGTGILFRLITQRPIEFQMHSQDPDGEIHNLIGPLRTSRESGTFTARWDGTYIFEFERQLELQAKIDFLVQGEYGIVNMEGLEPTRNTPGPALVPLVAGILFAASLLRRLRRGREN